MIVSGCMSLLVRTAGGSGAESISHSTITYTPLLSLLPPLGDPTEISVLCLENCSASMLYSSV